MKRPTRGGPSRAAPPRRGATGSSKNRSAASSDRPAGAKRPFRAGPPARSGSRATAADGRPERAPRTVRTDRRVFDERPDPEERLTDISEPWNVARGPAHAARLAAARKPVIEPEAEDRPEGLPMTSAVQAPIPQEREEAPAAKRPRSPSRPKVPGPVHPDLQPRPRLSSAAVRAVAGGSKGMTQSPTDNVQQRHVTGDEDGMRLDRWLQVHFAGIAFSQVQRIIRKGELRVDGKRADASTRLVPGQMVRVPPLRLEVQTKARLDNHAAETRAFLASITLWEDDDVLVLDKPMGLAVQGGSGTVRHIDGMLSVLDQSNGQRPRLVHRIDKDTSGCLLIAKTRLAATELTKAFRSRSTRKVYWALVAGIPNLRQGRISGFLIKDEEAEAEGEAKMRVAEHGEDGAVHALTYYSVVEKAARICAWVSLKPVTGRTHQLRAHMAHIGNPIIGDAKYFDRTNWELPDGMQNRLHLLARRIVVPHPRTGKPLDVTAPLPAHMQQSWSLLGFDVDRYDPIDDAPEE
jgi:23S rRNA pseudouridine955/2504/2580 synthase